MQGVYRRNRHRQICDNLLVFQIARLQKLFRDIDKAAVFRLVDKRAHIKPDILRVVLCVNQTFFQSEQGQIGALKPRREVKFRKKKNAPDIFRGTSDAERKVHISFAPLALFYIFLGFFDVVIADCHAQSASVKRICYRLRNGHFVIIARELEESVNGESKEKPQGKNDESEQRQQSRPDDSHNPISVGKPNPVKNAEKY